MVGIVTGLTVVAVAVVLKGAPTGIVAGGPSGGTPNITVGKLPPDGPEEGVPSGVTLGVTVGGPRLRSLGVGETVPLTLK